MRKHTRKGGTYAQSTKLLWRKNEQTALF